MEQFTGIIGVMILLGIAYLLSNNRKLIDMNIIAWGLGLQISFAFYHTKNSFRKILIFLFKYYYYETN